MLQTVRVNSKLSVYAYLFDIFDYNKTLLVPPGTRVIVHNKFSHRVSWVLNGEKD